MDVFIIVDSVFRGSRLQLTNYFINSLSQKAGKIILLTRTDYINEHYKELIENKYPNLEIVTVNVDFKGEWNRPLNIIEMLKYQKMILSIEREFRQDSITVFFTAIDDYFIPLVFTSLLFKPLSTGIDFCYLRYRTAFLYKTKNIKYAIQKSLLKLLLSKNDIFFHMDENLNRIDSVVNAKTYFLPEPWDGDFREVTQNDARDKLDIDDSDFIFLTIGKQDKRKGLIELLLALISDKSILDQSKIMIVGNIDPSIKKTIDGLLKMLPRQSVVLNETFVEESMLPMLYNSADCILLPYSTDFVFSSGVLTRAAASRVPVLASKHGIVGDRVSRYNLGYTFDIEDTNDFAAKLNNMISNGKAIRMTLEKSDIDTIDNGYIVNFTETFLKAFN